MLLWTCLYVFFEEYLYTFLLPLSKSTISGLQGTHTFSFSTVVLKNSRESDYQEGLFNHRSLGLTWSFSFSRSGVRPESLYFWKVPGDAGAPGPGTTLWEPLLSRCCQTVLQSICTNWPSCQQHTRMPVAPFGISLLLLNFSHTDWKGRLSSCGFNLPFPSG